MKPEKLMDAIGEVDEALLTKTEKGARVPPRRLTSFLAVAACFCLIVGAGMMANRIGFFGYKAEGPVAEEPAEGPVAEEPAAEEPAAMPEGAESSYDVSRIAAVTIDGEPIDAVEVDGVLYIPASSFREEWPKMHCYDDGTTDGIQLREGENTVRIDGIQYVLEYLPFRKTQDGAEVLYVPAQELGELLHYDAAVDPDTGVLRLTHSDRTWESFRGTRLLVLEYGPGTTTQELKEHLACLYENKCPLGTLTDLDRLGYNDQLVCIVLNPGSFSDFSTLQVMQYEIDARDQPPMCIALDPANLGGLSEKDCSDWCWNDGLPFYYRLTEQTAQLPEEQLDAAISEAWDFMKVATVDKPLFAACPEECRELLAERFAYIFSDDGSVWYNGTQMDTVVRQTVTPDTNAQDLMGLVRATFQN